MDIAFLKVNSVDSGNNRMEPRWPMIEEELIFLITEYSLAGCAMAHRMPNRIAMNIQNVKQQIPQQVRLQHDLVDDVCFGVAF